MVMKVEIAIMSFVGCCIHSMMKKRLPNYTPNVRNSLIESGFKDVTIERMDVSFNFDSAEAYTSFVYETALLPFKQCWQINRKKEEKKY